MPKKPPASSSSAGRRGVAVRVKTARKRSNSSTRWLQRQLNDPYVAEARRLGYRSRAAFKLAQLNEQYHFFRQDSVVVDLGAAPGGWSQVVAEIVRQGRVLALDILPMEPVPGVEFFQLDFHERQAPEKIIAALGGLKATCVLSDMAPPTTGHAPTDHLRIMDMCELAYQLAQDILAPGGMFLCKTLQGGTENTLLAEIKKSFEKVLHAKPAASRKDSAEMYLLAMGYRPSFCP